MKRSPDVSEVVLFGVCGPLLVLLMLVMAPFYLWGLFCAWAARKFGYEPFDAEDKE